MRFTVIGAGGYIGSHLFTHLQETGHECLAVLRDDSEAVLRQPLGHVFYCAGVTTDFLARPYDGIDAHVCDLKKLVREGSYQSLTYLSSTRTYLRSSSTNESAPVSVMTTDPEDLYGLSKLLGEGICRLSNTPARAVRLSNVYGPDWTGPTFLTQLIRMACAGRIQIAAGHESEKDYVSLRDVIKILPKIATSGHRPVYNVAAGRNTTHELLAAKLKALTGCEVEFRAGGEPVRFPPIDVSALRADFSWRPCWLLEDLPSLVDHYRDWAASRSSV